ncbi:N-acetylmuramoyl-L-alanine amidase [Actinomadura sp. NEAU-AAG5]|uniref:N-acetylmuramoyl-L-alanine amidase n=2 Tax=Actinomadura litoris TaxID=2678616 RepID=A0A7K1L113_9ACTN|nr:N-acetylmuramoyl-L-alanine amidase [Actinomadura litoris]
MGWRGWVLAILCLVGGCSSGGDGEVGSERASPASPTPSRAGMKGKVIVLDPGHNGGNARHLKEINKKVFIGNGYKPCNTTGTETADGYTEHAFTWDLANRLANVLREAGAQVVLTRKNDKGVGPCVTERAAIGNRLHADAVLSIHADGAPPNGHGFHVIRPLPVGKNASIVSESGRLGTVVRDAYRTGTGIPYSTYVGRNGLDQRDDLGGLNMSTVPVVFIECGNMGNPGDASTMSDATSRQRMAVALARGFEQFLR